MQQQIINNNNVHVKVQCDNEFRRFVLAEVTYSNLATTIRSLLGFNTDSVLKLSYLDDENDWVYFATDSELQYAVTLSKSPLKISVKLSSASETPVEEETADEENTPWKWRGGRGGRGCRGGRGGASKVERIDAKVARLNERHAMLSAKLIEGDLPQEKARALEWRLSHLQNKIDSLKAKKEQLSDACAGNNKQEHLCEAPVSQTENDETQKDEADTPCEFPDHPHPHWHRRGGWGHGPHGRKGGRGCHRFGGEHPALGEGFPPRFPHHHHFGGDHPHPPFHHPHHPHHHFGGEHPPHHPFGGCARRERGGEKGECERKKGCGGPAFVHACSIPEGKAAFDKLHAAKEALVKARQEKADKEVIMAKLEDLKEAKAAWREIKLALWKEQKEQQRSAGCPRKQAK